MVRIDRALLFPLEDERWQTKLGIGAGISLIPLVGWILLMGYLMRVARQVIRGDDETLPEWNDWPGLARDGLRWLGVVMVWHLPVLVVAALIVPTSALTTADVEDFFGGGGPLLRLVGYAVVAAYVTLVAFLLPAALARTTESRSLREGVDFLAVPRVVRANLVVYVAVFLATAGIAEMAKIAAIVPYFGVIVVWAYVAPVVGHLYGQAFRIAISGGLHRQAAIAAADVDDETIDLWQAIENVVGVPGWQRRLLIAIALGAIPIVGWALLLGYAGRVVRMIADGSMEARPEFDNYEEMAYGAQALAVVLIWTIPVWVGIDLSSRPWSWLFYGELGARLTGFRPGDVPWSSLLYPTAVNFSLGTLLYVLGLVAQLLLPALVTRVVAERSLVLGFDVPGALQLIRDHPIPYATVAIIQLGVFSLAYVGFSLAYVGLAAVFGAGTLLVAHLYGQLYRIVEPEYVA